jgi:tRNA threonylcarbamoyladenosine biosynthesis protein TsaB
MGYLLAIETATTTARVAVIDAGSGLPVAARQATAERHSSNLLRLCDEALREAGLTPSALEAIACGAGPGSFTGLRVGLAVGKGLALPTDTPFILVSSLQALALDILAGDAATQAADAAAPTGRHTIAGACIDAGKGQIYLGLFRADGETLVRQIGEDWIIDPGELGARVPAAGRLLVAGNGALRHAAVIDAALAGRGDQTRRIEVAGPSAEAVARLALRRLGRGESDDLAGAVPAYGRPPDITRPKRPGG